MFITFFLNISIQYLFVLIFYFNIYDFFNIRGQRSVGKESWQNGSERLRSVHDAVDGAHPAPPVRQRLHRTPETSQGVAPEMLWAGPIGKLPCSVDVICHAEAHWQRKTCTDGQTDRRTGGRTTCLSCDSRQRLAGRCRGQIPDGAEGIPLDRRRRWGVIDKSASRKANNALLMPEYCQGLLPLPFPFYPSSVPAPCATGYGCGGGPGGGGGGGATPAATSTTPGTPITGHRYRTNGIRRNRHSPGTPTTVLRECGNDTSGRQNAATRRNMRRGERVTVQGPVKRQHNPTACHRGGGGYLLCHQRTP